MILRPDEAALGTSVGPAKLPALLASPDYYVATVWAWKLDGFGAGRYYLVA